MGPQIRKFMESRAGLAPVLMPTALHVMVPGEGSLSFHFTETRGQPRAACINGALLECLHSEAQLLTLSNPGTECSSSGKLLQMGFPRIHFCHILRPVSYSAF